MLSAPLLNSRPARCSIKCINEYSSERYPPIYTLLRATGTTCEPELIDESTDFICLRRASASASVKKNRPRSLREWVPETKTNSSEPLLRAYTGTPASRSSITSDDMAQFLAAGLLLLLLEVVGLNLLWSVLFSSEILAKKGFLREGFVCKLFNNVENWVWIDVMARWRSSWGDGGGPAGCRSSLGLKKFMGFGERGAELKFLGSEKYNYTMG